MKKYILTLAFIYSCSLVLFPQTRLLYTYVDYKLNEARAGICDTNGKNTNDIGFNKSFLPAWFGDTVLFNGQSTVWRCDAEGEKLAKVCIGFRASVSHSGDRFACYHEDGVKIVAPNGSTIKNLEVEPWEDMTITWGKGDSWLSFYNLEKQTCYLYFLKNDSIAAMGQFLYQPSWNENNDACVYNQADQDGLFGVYIDKGGKPKRISEKGRMSVVPSWSPDGNQIAYLSVFPDTMQSGNSDMYRSELLLYDVNSASTITLVYDAGFSDGVYPQLYFDEKGESVFYTAITKSGNGALRRIFIKTGVQVTIKEDEDFDYRFPIPNNRRGMEKH